MKAIDWEKAFQPLIKKYAGKKHPLDHANLYQLVVAVILSAQDSDKHINEVGISFFKAFPNMESLAKADAEALYPFIAKVRNFGNKTKWLLALASKIKKDANIPLTMEELTELPGIGRKSANVIMRESGVKAVGVIVDLHVVRVAPRIGIATGEDPKKIEKQIMELIPEKYWGEIGMAISFLGREICRPSNPKCGDCVMKAHCDHYSKNQGT